MAAGDGLVSMKPTSIDHVGTSAVINDVGGVDFTAVTSLSLDGVFTSDYDNYLIVIEAVNTTSDSRLDARLRVSGSDASGSNYTTQNLQVGGTTVGGSRHSSETAWRFGVMSSSQRNGNTSMVYGPALAQATAFRTVTVDSVNDARIVDRAGTHSLGTAYDGVTLIPSAGSFTGNIHVFGYEE